MNQEFSEEKAEITIWRYNGFELTLDCQDAETNELYENTFKALSEEEKALPRDGKISDQIRAYCKMFRNLFNALFGEGTDVKLLGERDNIRDTFACYESFLEFVARQNEDVIKMKARMMSRYSPNRAQRRAGEKV